jgi:glycosyltransferase involved in cell wall biosynthesis
MKIFKYGTTKNEFDKLPDRSINIVLLNESLIAIEPNNYLEISNLLAQSNQEKVEDLPQLYHRLFSKAKLSQKIRRSENDTLHYCYLSIANYYYQQQEYSIAIHNLCDSLKYSQLESTEIIDRWINFLADNSQTTSQKVKQNFATIADWQKLIDFTHKHQPPRVSVIIPTYNCSQYLPQAIDSVLNQTYKNQEIIVVDDGSIDNTSEIIKSYLSKIRYVYQENQGVSEARNRGLYLAKGELIAFLDADDLFLPTKIERQVAIFDVQPEIGIVNSGFRIITENGEALMDVRRWQEIPDLTPEIWLLYKPVLPSAMMFRREWFERVGGFDSRYFSCEDVEMTLRMVVAGCQAIWLPEVTVGYRQHQQSATWRNSLRQVKNAEQMQDDFFAREDLPESIRNLEDRSRFYHFSWSAWLCYQSGNFTEMSEYLKKSRNHTPFSWVETIAIWVNTFDRCAKLYALDFDAVVLNNLPEWQQVISRLQVSRLFNSYYQEINPNYLTRSYPLEVSELPLYAQTFFQLGNDLTKQKNLDRAIDFYNRAIELEPKNADYHHGLATAFINKYELQSAIIAYQRAVRLKPNITSFQQDLDRALQLQKRWQELTNYCQQMKSTSDRTPKILMIFPYPPYPPQKGGAAMRMFEQIKYFGSRYRLTVVSTIFNEDDREIEHQLQSYCDRAFMVKLGERMHPHQPNLQRQIYDLKTWNMWKTLEQLSQIDYDLVLFDFIISTSYYPLFADRFTVLNEHNIESKLLQRCATEDNAQFISKLAKEIDDAKPFLNSKSEAKLLAEYETRTWQQFPLRTVVSHNDKQELDSRCSVGKTIVVQNGIDTQNINLVNNQNTHKLLFMGTMTYYPNIDAVLYFTDCILPELTKTNSQINLVIAGRKPPSIVQNLATLHSSIEVIADPEDMSLVAQSCSIAIVPLRLGSGTRIKILHAMAMGLPVVSTSLGCEGLDVIDGVHLLIRDEPQAFAEAILQLDRQIDLWQQLRENGRNLVETKYDWQNIFADYEKELFTNYFAIDRKTQIR